MMVVKGKGVVLTPRLLQGLTMLHRYRFFTIPQFAAASGFSPDHAGEALRNLEKIGLVGFLGFTPLPGAGRTPKVYFLRRKGFDILREEGVLSEEAGSAFQEVKEAVRWSQALFHRIALIDVFLWLEAAVARRPHLMLWTTLLEYKREKKRGIRETADYVSDSEVPENRVIPDGVFILKNMQSGRRGLFFVEVDRGSERITAPKSSDPSATITGKFVQYDRYLQSGHFATTYQTFGEFRSFLMLFVTTAVDRVRNIREACKDLPAPLHPYYRLATFGEVQADFLGPVWLSRDASDTKRYALVASA